MNKETKSPEMVKFLDSLTQTMFGKARSAAKATNCCVCCGGVATEFLDEISRREFGISGLCQICQDKTFGTGE